MFPAFIDVNNDHDDDISRKYQKIKLPKTQKYKNTKCQKTQKTPKTPKSQKRQKVPKIPEFDLSKFDTSKKGGYRTGLGFQGKNAQKHENPTRSV